MKIGSYQIKGKVTWIIWFFLTYVTHCSSVKLQARPNDKHFYVLTLWVVFDQQKFLNSWCSKWFVISSMPLNRHKVKEHRSNLYWYLCVFRTTQIILIEMHLQDHQTIIQFVDLYNICNRRKVQNHFIKMLR